MEEDGPCPDFASFTLAFALQLRKMHGKNLSQGKKNLSWQEKPQSEYSTPKKYTSLNVSNYIEDIRLSTHVQKSGTVSTLS
jgi:hypothetical protein